MPITPVVINSQQTSTLNAFKFDKREDRLITDKTIYVPSEALTIEEILTFHEQTDGLGIGNINTSLTSSLISAPYDRNNGSRRPEQFFLIEQENTLILQPVDTEVLSRADFQFDFVSSLTHQINKIQFSSRDPINNVSIKISDGVSGHIIKYIPSRSAYESKRNGIELSGGVSEIDLGESVIRLNPGINLVFEIQSDNGGFNGNLSDFPWLAVVHQRAEIKNIAWTQDNNTTFLSSNGKVNRNGERIAVDTRNGAVNIEVIEDFIRNFYVYDAHANLSNNSCFIILDGGLLIYEMDKKEVEYEFSRNSQGDWIVTQVTKKVVT